MTLHPNPEPSRTLNPSMRVLSGAYRFSLADAKGLLRAAQQGLDQGTRALLPRVFGILEFGPSKAEPWLENAWHCKRQSRAQGYTLLKRQSSSRRSSANPFAIYFAQMSVQAWHLSDAACAAMIALRMSPHRTITSCILVCS